MIVKQTNVIILSIMKGRINKTKTKDKLTSSHATAEKLNDSEEEDCGDEIREGGESGHSLPQYDF